MSDERLTRFDRNIVLRAGAGTGKTEALTSLVLRLLTGLAGRREPIAIDRIVALTFTEKAASEMRERIALALRQLVAGDAVATPLRSVEELRRLAVTKGVSLRRELCQAALHGLPEARITTLHAFCGGIVRQAALDLGLEPDFQLIDENRAESLLEEAIVQTVIERLRRGDADVAGLLSEMRGLWFARERGLVRALASVHRASAEHRGSSRDDSVHWHWAETARRVRRTRAYADLGVSEQDEIPASRLWEELIAAHEALPRTEGLAAATRKVALRVAELAASLRDRIAVGGLDELTTAAFALSDECGKGAAVTLEPAARLRSAICDLWALTQEQRRADAFLGLLTDASQKYAALKRDEKALDFDDLTVYGRNALRDLRDFREEVSRGIDALLVDEFQDTNDVQRDLIYLLRSANSKGVDADDASSLRPDGLFIVGDRKQSIYGFRGADVSVFEEVARDLITAGAYELSLTANYRSAPRLVDAVNELAAAALNSAEPGFGLWFDAETESLHAARQGAHDGPHVELLEYESDIGDPIRAEAAAIATRMKSFASKHSDVSVHEGGTWRLPRFGDMALLLPRFTHLSRYVHELDIRSIPHVIVQGRGLLEKLEVRDLLSLSSVLLGLDDGRGTLSVLRGPLTCLSDQTLLAIADQKGRLPWQAVFDHFSALADDVPSDEQARFRQTREAVLGLRGMIDSVGLGRSLRLVFDRCSYLAVLAGVGGAAQRVANVEKVLFEIDAREEAGEEGRAIYDDLKRRLRVGAREPEADVVAPGDDVVRVMTIHQAKGLQFPIVFAADLGRSASNVNGDVVFDRGEGAGVGLAVRDQAQKRRTSSHFDAVRKRAEERDAAERRRLFYVQITRAQDYLVLSGSAGANRRSIWKEVIEPARFGLIAKNLLRAVAPGDSTSSSGPRAVGAQSTLSLENWIRRASPPRPNVQTLEVPVTQLEDFVLCPRRFRARHVLRLEEHPLPRAPVLSESEDFDSAHARERGTSAHRVLETIDVGLARQHPEAALDRALLGVAAPQRGELRERLLPFVSGSFVTGLARLPSAALKREVPFSLAFPSSDLHFIVRGQIDLLVLRKGRAEVVDYKVTSPRGVDPTAVYAFQLSTYALAVRRAFDVNDVDGAIQFLDGRTAEPRSARLSIDDLEQKLPVIGQQVRAAKLESRYPGRERPYCESISCGYVRLCHGTQE